MLSVEVRPHRRYVKVQSADPQKLFVMLKLLPAAELRAARPDQAVVLVVDTSGSMYEELAGGGLKIERAIDAANRLIQDPRLLPTDRVAVIHFDDDARTLLPLQLLGDRSAALGAVAQLTQFSGGTMMGLGLQHAVRELSRVPVEMAKRVFLLTDGVTGDEEECKQVAQDLRSANAPVVGVGIGDGYNEDLLAAVAGVTLGTPWHLANMAELAKIFSAQLIDATSEVVTNVKANIRVIKDVRISALTRVLPSVSSVDLTTAPYHLGNLSAKEETVFITELDLPAKAAARYRIGQVGLTYDVPARRARGEAAPVALVVEYTADEGLAAQVDQDVMFYVQQLNVGHMIQQAAAQATINPRQAQQTLRIAQQMTQRLGNTALTQVLRNAEQELMSKGTLTPGTMKTMKVGSKTQTVRSGQGPAGLSEEEIRKLTGA